MGKFFKLKEHGTNVRTEIIAGATTFFTMAYIIFVNPQILSLAGVPKNGVFIATILAAIIGTLIMGLVANVPYAQAPGMGLNAFFTFTVVFTLGFTWQQALAMVFICGLINILITVTQIRKSIIIAIPKSLQLAIGGGIGLFIAYIGIKEALFIKFTSDASNILLTDKVSGTVVTNGNIVPALVNFTDPKAQLALIGLLIIVVLMMLRVKGSILIGIIATTLIGIPMGVVNLGILSSPNPGSITDIQQTFWQFDFTGLFADPGRILLVITTVFAFSLSDTFDTIGTFIGTGRKSGIFDDKDQKALFESKGFKSKMDKALFADATATSIGAILGTSNTTTYIESAAGISAGGRTGLTSVVTAIFFGLCLFLAPIAGIVPAAATAPALIIVGVMMMGSIGKIEWDDFDIALPAFLTLVLMPFTYSISNGIAAGFIFFVITKLAKGKVKEVHPILYVVSALFVLSYIASALNKI